MAEGDPYRVDAQSLRSVPGLATIETHDSIGSTNDRAKELLAEGAPLPALVVAREQTAGRGRGANRWWSSDGSLTFSLAVGPETPRATEPGVVSLLTTLALAEAVEREAGVAARVKWPNDLVVGVRKAAGVLLESPRPGRLVVGVGLNLNNAFDGAPDGVAERSIAIAHVAGEPVAPTPLLAAFVERWLTLQNDAAAGDPEPMRRANAASALHGATVTVETAADRIEGVARGFCDDGALLIETTNGAERVTSGTIASWRPPSAG